MQREEHFVLLLDSPASSAQRASVPVPVGLARWRARGGERSQVEFEARLFERDLRVQQVETVDACAAELVWREWRAGQGRTLRARAEDGVLELVEWGRRDVVRERLSAPAPVWFALHLVEAARVGDLPRSLECFDPLGRRVERLEVRANSLTPTLQLLRLNDASGACAGEYQLEGEALSEFRWQAGELRARAIERDEYERLERDAAAARENR